VKIIINLPDDLVQQAKKVALETGTTLTEIIGNALREMLAKRRRRTVRKDFKLITYGEGGLQPGVDLDDTSVLLDLMDGLDDPG
jgi:hypothetical protein